MQLNEKLKQARKEKDMTQLELAQELTLRGKKTSNTAIANWESGLNSPDIDTLKLICQILEKDGNYFIDDTFRMASYNGINVDGLDETDLKEIQEFVNFKRNMKYKKEQ